MLSKFLLKIKNLPKYRLIILIFIIWQYICLLGIALLNLPEIFIWLNLGLILGFLLICPVFESLLLLLLSSPFYVVLPNDSFDTLSMWRPLFFVLFLVWLIREKKIQFKEFNWMPWDKYLALFIGIALVISLIFSQYFLQSIKQIAFLFNIYIYYIVLINTIKTKQQIYEFIKFFIWSLAIIITLGFAQLLGTFLTSLDTFWVYWASNITKLYYGSTFSEIVLYSNSWFSYVSGRELRMFSIMPDSQSFAYVCLFALCLGTALTHNVFQYIKKWLWSGIRFAALALVFSGTRAVWVGMFLPFFAVLSAHIKGFRKTLTKKFLWPFIIVVFLFVFSPIFNNIFKIIRVTEFKENFIDRAKSIYNLNESSNFGRLQLWQNTGIFFLKNPEGVGLGNFLVSFENLDLEANYDVLANQKNEKFNLPFKYVSAHSLYLQVLVETGILGFLAFCAFFFSVLQNLWKFIKRHKENENFLVYFIAQTFVMVLWVIGAAFFDITLYNDKVLLFFLVNLGLAGVIIKNYHELDRN